MDDFVIAHPQALGEHVTALLRHQIVGGRIPVGTHLVEGRLSETFGVSRGPIRDALRQLQSEGLVEARRRGVFVLGLSTSDIDELYSLRSLIEAEALRRVMASPEPDWSRAREAVERMGRAADRGEVEHFAEADLDFHSAIYHACGHRRLADVWAQYKPTFSAMLTVTNARDARDLQPTHADHEELLAAAESGDQETALQLLSEHMDGSWQRMSLAQLGTEQERADTSNAALGLPSPS